MDGSPVLKSSLDENERRALRVNDAAFAYGIGRSTIYKLMSEGKLATVKIGGRRLIPRDALEALISEGNQ
jgi:excisionase family DNA binding protein